jgi:glutamine synthetase type III
MYFSQIISLLSNHRNSDRPEIPITLSKTQIISLVGSSLSLNESKDNLNTEINEALKELEAQGEINAGSGNRYCIAPPTVLTQAENNFTGLVFRGDRAYLSLAHKVLTTEQKYTEIKLRPRINNFQVIKNKLSQVGITLLTVSRITK